MNGENESGGMNCEAKSTLLHPAPPGNPPLVRVLFGIIRKHKEKQYEHLFCTLPADIIRATNLTIRNAWERSDEQSSEMQDRTE